MASSSDKPTLQEASLWPFWVVTKLLASTLLLWFASVACLLIYTHQMGAIKPQAQYIEGLVQFYSGFAGSGVWVEKIANAILQVTYGWTGLSGGSASGNNETAGLGARLMNGQLGTYIQLSIGATYLFGIKLALLLLSLPLYGLLLFIGVVDGLVERSVRKACGGHESATWYHRAKHYGIKLLPYAAALTLLASPIAFDPAWVLAPAFVLGAVLLRTQCKYYKKYG